MLAHRLTRRLRRRLAGERGSSSVELAVLTPALMVVCMLILQFGLWFNARQAALAAAQAGATVAREDAANPASGWQAASTSAAEHYYTALNTRLLGKLTATASGNPATNVYVTVKGPLGYSVFPFFGLHLTVSATAGGPVECFRSAVTGGRTCG